MIDLLPPEIMAFTLSYLPPTDVLSLALTSKLLHFRTLGDAYVADKVMSRMPQPWKMFGFMPTARPLRFYLSPSAGHTEDECDLMLNNLGCSLFCRTAPLMSALEDNLPETKRLFQTIMDNPLVDAGAIKYGVGSRTRPLTDLLFQSMSPALYDLAFSTNPPCPPSDRGAADLINTTGYHGAVAMLRYLLNDPEIVETEPSVLERAVSAAIRNNHTEYVQFVLNLTPAEVPGVDALSLFLPLVTAVQFADPARVELLLSDPLQRFDIDQVISNKPVRYASHDHCMDPAVHAHIHDMLLAHKASHSPGHDVSSDQ